MFEDNTKTEGPLEALRRAKRGAATSEMRSRDA